MSADNANTIKSSESATENTDKRTYTVQEIAALLQISKSKAYDLCKEEVFKTIKIGRSVRISKVAFDKWLDNQIM